VRSRDERAVRKDHGPSRGQRDLSAHLTGRGLIGVGRPTSSGTPRRCSRGRPKRTRCARRKPTSRLRTSGRARPARSGLANARLTSRSVAGLDAVVWRRKRHRVNHSEAFRFPRARDRIRTNDPHVGKAPEGQEMTGICVSLLAGADSGSLAQLPQLLTKLRLFRPPRRGK
jgi:hypothetical protein